MAWGHKLEAKSLKCIFLGYPRTQKDDQHFSPQLRKKFDNVDVTFLESVPFFSSQSEQLQENSFKTPQNILFLFQYLFLVKEEEKENFDQ